MSTLTGRLLMAFAGVILIAGVVTVGLAARSTSRQMRHVMTVGSGGQLDMLEVETLHTQLEDSFAETGDWSDAARLLDESAPLMRMMGGSLVLAGADGRVIAGAAPGSLSPSLQQTALPLVVDGATVGLSSAREVTHAMDPGLEDAVSDVNRAVLLAGLTAMGLAFALSMLIVRTISPPLGRVARAASEVSRGNLSIRAPEQGPAEVQGLARAFNKMTDSLNAQESMRRAMLDDIAHELRTPLSVIQGHSEYVKSSRRGVRETVCKQPSSHFATRPSNRMAS